MHAFPMFFKTTGRRVVIVGGGEQAAQKARLVLKTDVEIVIAAPELDAELAALVARGRARHETAPITAELFDDAAMAFIATGCVGVDTSVQALARAARCPVNVVDQPTLCDITTPAIVDRDPVVIAIGTEGTCPVLARKIKTQLEADLPHNLGGLAALAGRLRDAVAARVPQAKRREFWRWVFSGAPGTLWARGEETQAAEDIKAAIAEGGAPQDAGGGSIALIAPTEPDLLSLRAVQRLQEADVIVYHSDDCTGMLELARRDAERLLLSLPEAGTKVAQLRDPELGAREVTALARAGQRVVHIAPSGALGLWTESAWQRAAAHGTPVEEVPVALADAAVPERTAARLPLTR